MSDSIEFNQVPYDDENDTGVQFRDYLDQLIAHLDVDRVRPSCARERAVLRAVCGAIEASFNNVRAYHPRRADVFDQLASAFGWRGDEAELLAMWMSLSPSIRHDITTPDWRERDQEAIELLRSDLYSRHEVFWKRCETLGVDSFMCFWGRQPDPFAALLALIDEAAKALGDE